MSQNHLNSFQKVYNSCPTFWANYSKVNSWLKSQGFNPVNFYCPSFDVSQDLSLEKNQNSILNEATQVKTIEIDELFSEESGSEESASDEYDYVDDDYVRFIMETRKHQKEQEKLRVMQMKKEQQEEIVYKDIGEIDLQRLTKPKQPKNMEKNFDVNLCYGTASTSIEAKEALLQSDFNVYYDTHKPQFWPTIPVKIK